VGTIHQQRLCATGDSVGGKIVRIKTFTHQRDKQAAPDYSDRDTVARLLGVMA
jgi:hypothetical protein